MALPGHEEFTRRLAERLSAAIFSARPERQVGIMNLLICVAGVLEQRQLEGWLRRQLDELGHETRP